MEYVTYSLFPMRSFLPLLLVLHILHHCSLALKFSVSTFLFRHPLHSPCLLDDMNISSRAAHLLISFHVLDQSIQILIS